MITLNQTTPRWRWKWTKLKSVTTSPQQNSLYTPLPHLAEVSQLCHRSQITTTPSRSTTPTKPLLVAEQNALLRSCLPSPLRDNSSQQGPQNTPQYAYLATIIYICSYSRTHTLPHCSTIDLPLLPPCCCHFAVLRLTAPYPIKAINTASTRPYALHNSDSLTTTPKKTASHKAPLCVEKRAWKQLGLAHLSRVFSFFVTTTLKILL